MLQHNIENNKYENILVVRNKVNYIKFDIRNKLSIY